MRGYRYLLLAVVVALTTAVYVYNYCANLHVAVSVVVAARDLPQYHRLSPGDVRVVRIDPDARHPDAAIDLDCLQGLRLRTPVLEGEQILYNKVSEVEMDPGYLHLLAPEQRAFLIPDQPGRMPATALAAGSRVDLVYVGDSAAGGFSVAKCLLQGLQVLHVPTAPLGLRGEETAAGVIVAVTPAQAEQIAFALETGRVYITVDPLDMKPLSTTGVDVMSLFRQEVVQ